MSPEEALDEMRRESDEGDPNADLVGFEYKGVKGKTWKVVGTPAWSEGNYVQIECEDGSVSAVGAGLVRQRIREQRS